jgi:hypothetical protein
VGSRIAFPADPRCPCADLTLQEGYPLRVGPIALTPPNTPANTEPCRVTGNAALARGSFPLNCSGIAVNSPRASVAAVLW